MQIHRSCADQRQEFENAAWNSTEGGDNGQLWQDDWDDEDTNDDFTQQLREHLAAQNKE